MVALMRACDQIPLPARGQSLYRRVPTWSLSVVSELKRLAIHLLKIYFVRNGNDYFLKLV